MKSNGDVTIDHNGDLALTNTPFRDDVQQAYVRCMTDIGDYGLYRSLGASLSELKGMPQSPETGEYGVQLITTALEREGRFTSTRFTVNAVPTGPQSIRFDIMIRSAGNRQSTLSINQELGFFPEETEIDIT